MASRMPDLYILKRDIQGEKPPMKLLSVVSIGSPQPVQVLRGELLAEIPRQEWLVHDDGRPPYNFRSTKDPSVTLYGGQDDDYVFPLNSRNLQLLGAIEKPSDRYAVFSEDSKLEWGGKLKIGDQVYVRLPTPAPTWSAGVVRHVGPVVSLPGMNFGVEIKDYLYLGKGNTDGFFGGYNYFKCNKDCGLFVSLDKLAVTPPHKVPYGTAANGTLFDTPPRFKINDHVVVYNKKNVAIHGTVRWIGRDVQTRTLNTNHIGIETDSIVITNLFPKALTGITHLFKAAPGHRLVLPEHLVFREELAITRTPPARDIDLLDPAAAAREEGVSKRKLMAEQRLVLEKAEKIKAVEIPFSGVKDVLNESIDISKQKEMLDAYNKEKQEEAEKKDQQEQARTNVRQPSEDPSIRKQNSWQHYDIIPGSRNSTHPLPRQNERVSAKVLVDHERQQREPGSLQTYPQPPHDQDPQVNSRNQMAPQNTAGPDYAKRETVDQYSRSQRNYQGNPVYPLQPDSEHYQHGYQYQPPSAQECGRDPNNIHPPPSNNQAYGYQPHHDTPGGHHQNTLSQVSQEYNASVGSSNPYNLAVGSTIQVPTINPNDPPHYGVIRWTGRVAGVDGQVVGIELEDYMDGCTDGTFKATGEKYFTCTYGKGLYFPLASLRPDERFGLQAGHAASSLGNPIQVPMEEKTDQFINDPTEQMMRYIGNSRGIQGHQNSCYMDSTIFGLFALSDVFDTMFLDPDLTTDQNRKRVADLLWKGIVNPLRKNGVVRFESVMKMTNALEELGKMEGITEKEKDPEEFLNMLFKHMLHTKAFISIRRPFGVEQEFFVQLFVEHDPNLRLPTVGDLLRKMYTEQVISFTKVPSKLLIQVPRFGREFQTYKRIVPELKLNIRGLTDTYKKSPACYSCGEESVIKCESCGPLSQQQFTHYCQRCSDLFHSNTSHKDRANHRLNVAVATDDPGLAQLDLLSVICIDTSHYVCFTRDPRDDIQKKWIFFDSIADRQCRDDTYNIPRVTDCTRELNEWVYEGDQDRLINTPPRELPELVRRFTQDIYMCVYVQPDVAMYGDADEEEDYLSPVRESYSIVSEVSKLKESKDDIVEEFKQENTSLQAENRNLKQRIETYQAELQRYNERERTTSQEMAEKEEQKQQSDNEKRQLERQKQYFQQQAQDMQRRLEVAESKTSQSKFSKLQIPRLDQDSWNVRRQEVVLQDNLGHGAWGSVCRGLFRGQQVAVKCAHTKILHKNTIDQLKREIRIMAHVQHPNLVRLIAAVVDAGVERGTDSPLLVLEFLDTDLRSAYEKKIVNFQKDALLSIFREVAYALHYLHEHQEPIIHRDVSAPNVLLQQIHPRVWKAKLSDFGSANLVKHSKTPAPGAIIYSAPETFPSRVVQKQTTKIDVYSYGYLLAEAIAKEMPSEKETLLLKIQSEWVDMYNVITACTAYEQEDRLTMTQVLEQLNKLPSH